MTVILFPKRRPAPFFETYFFPAFFVVAVCVGILCAALAGFSIPRGIISGVFGFLAVVAFMFGMTWPDDHPEDPTRKRLFFLATILFGIAVIAILW